MKACPVCNEMFVDEMNFCDVDGSPLKRDPAAEVAVKNKLWSVLGVGLLIGALMLSLAVVLMPKPRPALPEPATPVTASVPEASSPETAAPVPAVPASESETSALQLRASELKAREREAAAAAATEPAPNPKAAALDKGTTAGRPDRVVDTTDPGAALAKPEATRTSKPGEDVTEPPTGSADPKDAKKVQSDQPENSKAADKDSKKKTDEKDKKKGGFFRVFKKIFGKE